MATSLREKVWSHGYRLRCIISQAGTREAGQRIPVYAHRDELVRDMAWLAYETDTVGALVTNGIPVPAFLAKRKLDALRHPTQMAARMQRGLLRHVRIPAGDCEDWAGLILACGLAGFAKRGWLNVARYPTGAHAVAEWEDADGTWSASNWQGGRPVFGRPAYMFRDLTSLIRWPVHLAQDQSLVLGWPEVVA